jgi:hypothetical protein
MPSELAGTRPDGTRTEVRWSRAWPMLFRAFQLARDPYKIAIAAGAVVALSVGWWILDRIFPTTDPQAQAYRAIYGSWPAHVDRGENPFQVVVSPDHRGLLFTRQYWIGTPNEGPPLQVEPFRQFYQPILHLFRAGGWDWWYLFFGILWTLVVWSLAAGAITRIAAVQIARNEQIGMGEALAYSRRKFFDYFIGPAIPLIILFILAILNAIGTELAQIPYLGIVFVALLYLLPFLAALVMAAMIIALIGWPLFYATISAEGSDSFDALSRTLAYITSRSWSFVKYAIVGLIYSIIVIFIVVFLVSATVYLTRWSMGLAPGLGWQDTGDPVGSMHVLAPRSYDWRGLLVNRLDRQHPLVRIHNRLNQHLLTGNNLEGFKTGLAAKQDLKVLLPEAVYNDLGFNETPPQPNHYAAISEFYLNRDAADLRRPQSQFDFVWAFMNWGQKTAAGITGFWLHLIFLGLVGFAFSLFWSLGTIIYFLLRREVDETEYEEVYIEDEDELIPPPISSAPTTPAGSGVPTSEQRPTIPPVLPPPGTSTTPPEPPSQPDRPPGFTTKEPPTE